MDKLRTILAIVAVFFVALTLVSAEVVYEDEDGVRDCGTTTYVYNTGHPIQDALANALEWIRVSLFGYDPMCTTVMYG